MQFFWRGFPIENDSTYYPSNVVRKNSAMFLASQLPLFGLIGNDLWYALPLVIVISLVYGGTRHERNDHILIAATRFATWIAVFMLAIFVILALMSWYVSR